MSNPTNTSDPLAAETAASAPKKRTRVQFSCTACRYRKLKCCRTYPCTNCKKRGEAASCAYVGRGPRGKAQHGRSSPTLVQNRLQHLENLVMSLAQKQKPTDQIPDFNAVAAENRVGYGYDTPPSANDREKNSPSRDTGTLVVNDEGTSYIDSANWRAILEEINGVKEYLDEHGNDSDDDGVEDDPYVDSSPALLLGTGRPLTKEELLVDIPPRSTADRLISRFLKTSDPSLVVVHVPTFQREYEQFWNNPQGVSFTWIALLYSILTLSVSIYHRGEEPLPLNLVDPMTLWNVFRKRAAQCLVQANYLTPGRYKAEALFLYGLGEFHRSQDAQVGVSYLLGITIRLAMRMGYHRDASHYPNLSAWEGEMRRRLWALLCQLDALISFQVGLPRTIQPWHSDTEIPSNLLDTDFDENSTELPPGRPDEERTACSYTRGKARIMTVFGQTVDLAYSREQVSYDQIMEIDRRLEEAHDLLPSFFHIRPMAQCIADSADLMMRRYTLELLYQKSRIVLHRRYMAETHSKYAYSRSTCLEAARETLRHHAEIWSESMPGGQLYAERFFLNSLQNTDFMLSAMILCLELSQDNEWGNAGRLGDQERTDLLLVLETTHRIFKGARRRSMDTQRAFAALTLMLSRVKGSSADSLTSKSDEPDILMSDKTPFQPGRASMDQQQHPMYNSAAANMQTTMFDSTGAPLYSSLGVIEEMLNAPAAQLDWRLYDSRVSGFEAVSQDNLWYSNGPAAPPEVEFIAYPSGV